jgi:hypothetical protein
MSLARVLADNFKIDPTKSVITGNGTTTVFSFNGSPGLINPNEVFVTLDGAVQEPTIDYTVNGNTITFTTAPDNGAKVVIVYRNSPFTINLNVPPDGSVTNEKIAANTIAPDRLSSGPSWYDDTSILTKGIYATAEEFFVRQANLGDIKLQDYEGKTLVNVNSATGNVGLNTVEDSSAKLEVVPNDGQLEILKLKGGNPWTFKHDDQGESSDIIFEPENKNGNFKIITNGNTVFSNAAGTSSLSINANTGDIRAISTSKAWINFNSAYNQAPSYSNSPVGASLIPTLGTYTGKWTGGGWTVDHVGLIYNINVGGNFGNLGGIGGFNFIETNNIPTADNSSNLYNSQFVGYHKSSQYIDINNIFRTVTTGGGSESFYSEPKINNSFIGVYSDIDNSITWTNSTKLRPRRVVVVATGTDELAYSDFGSGVENTTNTSWTKTLIGLNASWNKIIYGKNLYVAIQATNSDKIAWSVTGVASSWTIATLPSVATWRDIAYGKTTNGSSKYVIVGDASKAAYSDIATQWAAVTLPTTTSNNWFCITYGNGKFVTLSSNTNKGAYSTDGRVFTLCNLPISANWTSITYGNGKFVAAASDTTQTIQSTDGINWTITSNQLPTNSFWRLSYGVFSNENGTFGNGVFVALYYNANNDSDIVCYSTDGTISWQQMTMPLEKRWRGVSFGQDRFTAISIDGKVAYSNNGIDWVLSTVDLPSMTNGGGSSQWSSCASIDDMMAFNNHSQTAFTDNKILHIGGYKYNPIHNRYTIKRNTYIGTVDFVGNVIDWVEATPGSHSDPLGTREGSMHHTATKLNDGRVLVTGGVSFVTSTSAYQTLNNTYFGTVVGNTVTWAAGTALPAALMQHTVNLLDTNRIVLIGGITSTGLNNQTFYASDTNTKAEIKIGTIAANVITWSAAAVPTKSGVIMPPLKKHTTVQAGTNRLLVFGGTLTNGQANNKIYSLIFGGTLAAPTVAISVLATLPAQFVSNGGATGELINTTNLLLLDKSPQILNFAGSPIPIRITGVGGAVTGTAPASRYAEGYFEFVNAELATDDTSIVGTGASTGFSYSTDGVYSKYNVLSITDLGTGKTRITFNVPFKDRRKVIMTGSTQLGSDATANTLHGVMLARQGYNQFNPTATYADIITSNVAATAPEVNTVQTHVVFHGD